MCIVPSVVWCGMEWSGVVAAMLVLYSSCYINFAIVTFISFLSSSSVSPSSFYIPFIAYPFEHRHRHRFLMWNRPNTSFPYAFKESPHTKYIHSEKERWEVQEWKRNKQKNNETTTKTKHQQHKIDSTNNNSRGMKQITAAATSIIIKRKRRKKTVDEKQQQNITFTKHQRRRRRRWTQF